MTVTRTLDSGLYPEECLKPAAGHFREACTVTWTPCGETIDLHLEPKPGSPPGTVDEFLNYLLLAALEKHLA